MKRKSLFISIALFGMSLASCSFPNIFGVKLKSITISDLTEKTYCIGESYLDYADLTIQGRYSDEHVEFFDVSEVKTSLTFDGNSYDPTQPFEVAGNYSFRVSKDGVKSKALSVTVLESKQYVDSISISGEHSVAANRSIELTVDVSPSDYTVDLDFSSSNTDIARVEKLSKSVYRVTGVSEGDTSIIFSADSGTSTPTTYSHQITVTPTYATSMVIKSGSSVVAQNAFVNVTLGIEPLDFSTEVTATSSSEHASVEKVDNTHFKVYGHTTGNAVITFTTLSGPDTYISVTHNITVSDVQKTTIAQTYNDYIKNNGYTLSSCPLTGNAKLLVIPLWFNNSDSYITTAKKESVRNDIQTAYFGTSEETGWHSVSSYYRTESEDRLNLTGTVSEWYEPDISSSEAGSYNESQTNSLITRAVTWYFSNHSSDRRRNYDSDGDGYIDSVMVIYGAPDNSTDRRQGSNMWAYCYWVQDSSEKSTSSPGTNVYFWASYDFMYGTNASSRTGKNYGGGDTSHCTLDTHTFIHEMGHVLGLEDYYDYAHGGNPAAGFSMQDYNVGGHDPFSLMAFGWADPYIPATSTEITIGEFQSTRELILLTPTWNSYDSAFDEYLLLELYSPNGLNAFDSTYTYSGNYPKGPSTPGIRLWHVDARVLERTGSNRYQFSPTCNIKGSRRVLGAFNNTSDYEERPCSAYYYLGNEAYQSMDLLHLIRNSTSKEYRDNSTLVAGDLFVQGSSFSISSYKKQFYYGNQGKLDNGVALGWTFSVSSIFKEDGMNKATIRLTKV